MPALTAIITANARQLNSELDRSLRTAQNWAKDMKRGMNEGGEYASVLTQGDVSKALKGVGEAASGAHIPVRGLSHLFSELGVKGAGFTSVIVHAFTNPIFLAIGVAAGALWLFNKALQALIPIADTLGTKSLAPQMEKFAIKTIEAKAAMLEWASSLSKGRSEADKLNDSLAQLANTTEAWASADNKVATAAKELELAKIKQLESQGKLTKQEAKKKSNEVENTFDLAKIERDNKNRGEIRKSLWDAADKADAKSKEARESVTGLGGVAESAQSMADANSERIKNAEENLKKLEKKKAEIEIAGAKSVDKQEIAKKFAMILGPAGVAAAMGKTYSSAAGDFAGMGGNAAVKVNQDVLDKAKEVYPGLLADAKIKKGALDEAEKSAIKLREDADAKRRTADMAGTKSAAEYKSDKDAFALRFKKREIEGEDSGVVETSKSKRITGHLTSLQQVGAYASPASNVMVDTAKKSERHLEHISRGIDRLTWHGLGGGSGVKY